MHKRQQIREAIASALAGVPAKVVEELAFRPQMGDLPIVSIALGDEAADLGAGTMGEPEAAARELNVDLHIWTEASTGKAAIDAANDLDETMGVALGVASGPGQLLDSLDLFNFQFSNYSREVITEDQDRFWVRATSTYIAGYQTWFGDPT